LSQQLGLATEYLAVEEKFIKRVLDCYGPSNSIGVNEKVEGKSFDMFFPALSPF
jgi:hypothetical protein